MPQQHSSQQQQQRQQSQQSNHQQQQQSQQPPPLRTMSTDSSTDSTRKRVCKACDRCRLKKSKCDGSHPCSRCKADNAICVFGERKKSHDKVYPKGYVEMLEQQQSQMVAGLQDMYKRMLEGQNWPGPHLSEESGHPLTHDILAALHLLEPKADNSGEMEVFEEDCSKLQARLLAEGAPYVARRGSFSSESEHSTHSPSRKGSATTTSTTATAATSFSNSRPSAIRDNFAFTPSPSPLSQSPLPQPKMFPQIPQSSSSQAHVAPLGSNGSPLTGDPQFFQSPWIRSQSDAAADTLMNSRFALQTPELDNSDLLGGNDAELLDGGWEDSPLDLGMYGLTSFPPSFLQQPSTRDYFPVNGGALDPMDLDLSRAVPVVK